MREVGHATLKDDYIGEKPNQGLLCCVSCRKAALLIFSQSLIFPTPPTATQLRSIRESSEPNQVTVNQTVPNREPWNRSSHRNRWNRNWQEHRNRWNRNPKFITDLNGVRFGRTELSIPPFEISRRDLQDGHGFRISFLGSFGFCVFSQF